MADPFDAYHKWLAIPPEEQPANAYRLLGVKIFETDLDVISNAADARMAQVRTFQTGKHAALSQKLLNELATARVSLLDPAQKAAYDKKLRAAAPRPTPVPVAVVVQASPVAVTPQPVLGFDPQEVSFASQGPRSSLRQSRKKEGLTPLLAVAGTLLALIVVGLGYRFLTSDDQPPAENLGAVAPAPAAPAARKARAARKPPVAKARSQPSPEASALPSAEPSPSPAAEPGTSVAPEKPDNQPVDEGQRQRDKLTLTPATGPTQRYPTRPDAASEAAAAPNPNKSSSPPVAGGTSEPAAISPAPAPGTLPRMPAPDSEARKAALAIVMEVYEEEFSKAKKPVDKLALSGKLLQQGESDADRNLQFVLLSEAQRLAQASGAPGLTAQSIHALAERFEINEAETLADAFDKFSDKSLAKSAWTELVDAALPQIDGAIAAEQFDLAKRILTLALAAAKKSGQAGTIRQLAARVGELAESARLFAAAQAAKKKLETAPNDAEAHTALGKYLCFGYEDWQTGLPHLAQGADPALKQLAAQEATAPTTIVEQIKLADGWWDLAAMTSGPAKMSYLRRAARWYRPSQSELSGLEKVKVDKRLQTLADKLPSLDAPPARGKSSLASPSE